MQAPAIAACAVATASASGERPSTARSWRSVGAVWSLVASASTAAIDTSRGARFVGRGRNKPAAIAVIPHTAPMPSSTSGLIRPSSGANRREAGRGLTMTAMRQSPSPKSIPTTASTSWPPSGVIRRQILAGENRHESQEAEREAGHSPHRAPRRRSRRLDTLAHGDLLPGRLRQRAEEVAQALGLLGRSHEQGGDHHIRGGILELFGEGPQGHRECDAVREPGPECTNLFADRPRGDRRGRQKSLGQPRRAGEGVAEHLGPRADRLESLDHGGGASTSEARKSDHGQRADRDAHRPSRHDESQQACRRCSDPTPKPGPPAARMAVVAARGQAP